MEPVIVTKNIHATPERIWTALTAQPEMIQWFFDNIPDFKAEEGFTTQFVVDAGERQFLHVWTVTEVVPVKKIVCAWRYPDYLDDSFEVAFTLTPLATSTQFTVTASGIEKFAHINIPEFTRESCIGGWNYFSERLKVFVEGS